MAKIIEYQDIPLDELTIGKGQVRTQDVGKDIDDLARSIKVQGLLQPIVVCRARDENKWEILTGQRRFLAHKLLGLEKITAAVLDERVDEGEAKAISITENLIRRKLSGKELIEGVTYLYNLYGGNASTVAGSTGLSYRVVLDYVKYPRLIPELKKLVDDGEIDVKVALKAQDAATDSEFQVNVEDAIKLSKEMRAMSGVQQTRFSEEMKKNPEETTDAKIEKAKTGSNVTQIMVTITHDTHIALRKVATEDGTTQDEAASALIEEALVARGLLESS